MRAIVLSRTQEGENSSLLEVFSQEHGREIVRVRGTSEMDSKLRYATEPFGTIDADVVPGKRGLLAVSLVPEVSRQELRRDLGALAAAFAVAEALSELTPEGMPEPGLFELLEATLDVLVGGRPTSAVISAFFEKLFTVLGVGAPSQNGILGALRHAGTHFSADLPAGAFLFKLLGQKFVMME